MITALDSPHFRIKPPTKRAGEVTGPPDFVGIGAQRSGTSWWFDLLTNHPAVYHRPLREANKERQFFSHLALVDWTEDLADEYRRWFPRPSGMVTGEWTPDYMFCSWVPSLLKRAAPDTKLLVMLRDPVERCLSGLGLGTFINGGAMPPAVVMQDAIARGEYARQLGAWLAEFPREQLLVLQYEKCRQDVAGELARTHGFLGLEPVEAGPSPGRSVNRATWPTPTASEAVRRRLAELYRDDVRALVELAPEIDLSLWKNMRQVL